MVFPRFLVGQSLGIRLLIGDLFLILYPLNIPLPAIDRHGSSVLLSLTVRCQHGPGALAQFDLAARSPWAREYDIRHLKSLLKHAKI
jgi:hypothetical protein